MVFTEEDRIAIKFLRQNKGYGAKRLLKEFASKNWKVGSLNKLLKKIDSTGSIARRPGSGRRRSARTAEKVDQVGDLVQSQDDHPQTHKSQRQIARRLNISQRTVGRIIRNDLHLKCLKRRRATALTENNKRDRYQRAKELLKKYPASLVSFIVFTDEKMFTVARPKNSQNDRVYAMMGTVKKNMPSGRLLRTRPTFSKTVMVSVGISHLGRTGIHFIEPGVKIDGKYYREVLLMQKLLPDIRGLSPDFVFQQDSAPAHRARETVDLLSKETPEFIPPSLWPPNSPDLNPVDYSIWQVVQDRVYQETIENVDQLKQRIVKVWDDMDQTVIDSAVSQWRKRLHMCVRCDGDYFEHQF